MASVPGTSSALYHGEGVEPPLCGILRESTMPRKRYLGLSALSVMPDVTSSHCGLHSGICLLFVGFHPHDTVLTNQ
jgi:hypothetical protein